MKHYTSERSPIAPEVPPIADTVPGYDIKPWWGVSGPAGMPQEVVDKLFNATHAILKDNDTKQRYATMGLDAPLMRVKQFNDFTASELVKWGKIVRDSGVKVE